MLQHINIVYTAICNWLAEGQDFTADVKDYAENVLGVCNFTELASLLSDSETPDIEPFLEFLIFPNAALLEHIESHNARVFTQSDITLLTDTLCQETRKSVLRDGQKCLKYTIPEWLWHSFIQRLYLTDSTRSALRRLAPDIESALPTHIKAALRRSRLSDSPQVHGALLAFFTRIPLTDPLYQKMFSQWVNLLNSQPPESRDRVSHHTTEDYLQSLATFLEKHRRRLYKAIIEAQEFSIKLQRFNMETLMMSGERVPTIDISAVRFQLRLIDRLALGVFGHSVSSIEEQEDRQWGDYVDYRSQCGLLPKESMYSN